MTIPMWLNRYTIYEKSSKFEYDIIGNRTKEKHNTTRDVWAEVHFVDDSGYFDGARWAHRV